MSVTIFETPILVSTPLGDGYILYVKNNPTFENDEFTIVLLETGQIKHFLSDQIIVNKNFTYSVNIKK